MKLVDLDNPVRASWLADQGFRLDPGPYISETYAARMFLARIPRTDPLGDITERIFHAGRFKRHWTTDPDHGVPFLSSADIFESDLSSLPMITKSSFAANPKLPLEPGWTLITCSGMTAGRVTYARLDMKGYACSQDVLRVVPDTEKIPAGYLYTFLASPFGVPMIKGGIYGTSVKHIEPSHIVDLPVPRVGSEIEGRIDALIREAMELRARFQTGIVAATEDLFKSAGLPELLDLRWHELSRPTGFAVYGVDPTSLRALNYDARAHGIMNALRSVPHLSLGEICEGGRLSSGPRFKRIDTDPEHGVCLLGQRQAFWLRPEGRWISPRQSPKDVFVDEETVLIAGHGLVGESASICRAMFVTAPWTKYAYSQDLLRVKVGKAGYSGAYLFAFLRSEAAFRVLRSMLVGTGPQEIHTSLRAQLPVPECTPEDRERIAETVREAFRLRDDADVKEDQALELLDGAVREAAG